MQITIQQQGAVAVARPQGRLTHEEAEAFLDRLGELTGRTLGRFVIDFSAISFVDSRGLEVLLDLAEQMDQSGQTLKLCGAHETVREVFDLTDIGHRFEHYEDTTTAVRSFL